MIGDAMGIFTYINIFGPVIHTDGDDVIPSLYKRSHIK